MDHRCGHRKEVAAFEWQIGFQGRCLLNSNKLFYTFDRPLLRRRQIVDDNGTELQLVKWLLDQFGEKKNDDCQSISAAADPVIQFFFGLRQGVQFVNGSNRRAALIKLNHCDHRTMTPPPPQPSHRAFILIFFSLIFYATAFVHDSPECGEPFHCPDECVITWYGKCPSNCYCKPIKRCELVKCPYKPPRCIIVTGQDGCQRCACEDEFNGTNPISSSSAPETTEYAETPSTTTIVTYAQTLLSYEEDTEKPFTSNKETVTDQQTATTATVAPIQLPTELRANSTVRRTLEQYAQKICTQQYKTIIDHNFKALFVEVGSRLNKAKVYPSIFSFPEQYLLRICDELKEANRGTPVDVRRSCFRKYYVFDELISLLSYPCSSTTRSQFFGHFACIQRAVASAAYGACLPSDVHTTVRLRVRQLCPMIQAALPCLQRAVNGNCDYNAWTIFKQYLIIRLLKLDPRCSLQQSRA